MVLAEDTLSRDLGYLGKPSVTTYSSLRDLRFITIMVGQIDTALATTPAKLDASLDYDVIIIGGGQSGLYSLHRMRQLGLKTRLFEAGSGEGGTWFW